MRPVPTSGVTMGRREFQGNRRLDRVEGVRSARIASGRHVSERALMERRLAAILQADVVGFSRMVGEDETGHSSLEGRDNGLTPLDAL